MLNRVRATPKPMDPLKYVEMVLERADRRIRWMVRLSWVSLIVVLLVGAVEYIRLFTGFDVIDIVLLSVLAVATVGLFVGGVISGTFYAKPRVRVSTTSAMGAEDLDDDSLKDRVVNLLTYQVVLLAAAGVLVVAWVLQLMHPAASAPGHQFVALLPAAAFLCVMAAGAVNVFYRAKRTVLKERKRY